MKLEAGGGQDDEDSRRLLAVLAKTLDARKLRHACSQRNVLDRLRLFQKSSRE
ncbi:MAG: hypothetical protein HY078_05580 [Elusimicrobia bacterium]|nr:hypothetical protein [Elusimicrobiota bacterium]